MPKLLENRVPSYRLHRQSGQGVVTLKGRDILLGKFNSEASRAEYNLQISRWMANGRQTAEVPKDLTIGELILKYRPHVESYYCKPDGSLTREVDNIRQALRPLRYFYGTAPAAEFGPLKLKVLRDAMMKPNPPWLKKSGAGWTRRNINKAIGRIRMLFGWATEGELIPSSVYHGLLSVKGLKYGRSEARESDPVLAVDDAIVEATLPHLSSVVAAMVRLQRLTGARPVEPGLYVRSSAEPAVGRIVDFRIPVSARPYILRRTGQTGKDWYILKPIVAGPGDRVDCTGLSLFINERRIGPMPARFDSVGRQLPAWRQRRELGPDEFFVFSSRIPDSFDSRCYGPITRGEIASVHRPLIRW